MACASIGQGYLMSIYEKEFQKYNILVSQLLLTEDDFSNRIKYLNLSDVLNELIKLKVIPIINQNDAVSSSELETISDMVDISFSDNDKLSALVASRLEADLLIILSDIDGLYDDNPKVNSNAKFISVVERIDENIEKIARYFALKKHVPSKQEALNYIAVYKTPYNLYAKLCKIANVVSFVGFLLCLLSAVLIPPSWVDAFSVFYSLFLYVVVTNFMLRYFMGLKFRSASFAAVVLTKHYLGIVDLNSKK